MRMEKVNQKYSDPNGGEKWWFIPYSRIRKKSPEKQIQVSSDQASPRGWNKDQKRRLLRKWSPPYSTQLLNRWCCDAANNQHTTAEHVVQNPKAKNNAATKLVTRSNHIGATDVKYKSIIPVFDILPTGQTPVFSKNASWYNINSMISTKDATPRAKRNTANARRSKQKSDHDGIFLENKPCAMAVENIR